MKDINAGDTAWVLAAAALVMLMTPGLALFYGGMVRRRNTLNMMMMSFVCLGLVTVLWAVAGFGLAFGPDLGGLHGAGLLGTPDWFLHGARAAVFGRDDHHIPRLAYAMFQLMFAVLTAALISGAVAERMRFSAWMLFATLWSVVVYFPVAHWVFDGDVTDKAGHILVRGGWLGGEPVHALDFAGGTVVHINAGAAGLALALVVGRRDGWPRFKGSRHNVPLVLLGASLLWFGWYGFNAGSATEAGGVAALAFTNTTLATAVAVLAWMLYLVWLRGSRPSVTDAASGAVAGLVAITPACAYVDTVGALVIGVAAGFGCAAFVTSRWRYTVKDRPVDDALDVVGIHLVGGLIGTVLIGFFASQAVNGDGRNGLFYHGGLHQLWMQLLAAAVVMAYSFVVTYVLARFVVQPVVKRWAPDGMRVTGPDGLDQLEHGEPAYADAQTEAAG